MSEVTDSSVQTPTPSLVEQYWSIRSERLAADRESARLEVMEKKLQYQIVKDFTSLKCPEGYRAVLEHVDTPNIEEPTLFLPWVIENGAIDCLQKRLTNSAVLARLEAGETIPGIEVLKKPKLTIEKL